MWFLCICEGDFLTRLFPKRASEWAWPTQRMRLSSPQRAQMCSVTKQFTHQSAESEITCFETENNSSFRLYFYHLYIFNPPFKKYFASLLRFNIWIIRLNIISNVLSLLTTIQLWNLYRRRYYNATLSPSWTVRIFCKLWPPTPAYFKAGGGCWGGWRLFWVIWLSCYFLFWLAAD